MSSIADINLAGRIIGKHHRPFIIAEMSGNHNQSLAQALLIVDAAAKAGVDALKIQTYTADTMTIDHTQNEFQISDKNSLWFGQSLYQLYKTAHTPWEWHQAIYDRCKQHNIIAFSTPFDETAVDFLEELATPFYKIASFENTCLPLIERVAATGKPMIISTGMATLDELQETVTTARRAGCKELILLKCTSTYPATPEQTNIATIPHMRDLFQCQIGLSDHTLGIGVALASVALGATVIEKHFTLARSDGGVDAAFSLEPHEMQLMVQESERAFQSLGNIHYGPTANEQPSLKFRRSLYIVADIQAGEIFTADNLKAIRPGYGLPTKHYVELLGKKAKRNITRGEALAWDMIV